MRSFVVKIAKSLKRNKAWRYAKQDDGWYHFHLERDPDANRDVSIHVAFSPQYKCRLTIEVAPTFLARVPIRLAPDEQARLLLACPQLRTTFAFNDKEDSAWQAGAIESVMSSVL